jgi:hypothetical protein
MPDSTEVSSTLGGAAQGAAVGAAIAGPVGAVVGGVIGAVGGLFKGKSASYKRKSERQSQKLQETQVALQRRDLILEGYVQRARSVAAAAAQDEGGGLQSSAPLGAVSSVGSQLEFNLGYFDRQANTLNKRNKYAMKSGKYAQYASNVETLFSVGQSAAGFFTPITGYTSGSGTTSGGLGASNRANFDPGIYD